MTDHSEGAPKPEAPGAKASRTCGIIALVAGVLLGLFCIGLVAALVLGIIAIVQSNQAKRLAAENPETYAAPSHSGLVMGIVAVALPLLFLPIFGIMSAIAIPALQGQKARARDKAVVANVDTRLEDLVGQYDHLKEAKAPDQDLRAGLEAYLRTTGGSDVNPWNVSHPAFSYTLAIVDGITTTTEEAPAVAQPGELGQGVFMLQYPTAGHPGFLAGCARLNNGREGEKTYFHKVALP